MRRSRDSWVRESRDHGFTLLEVMIAMAVMALGFAAIIMVQSNSSNTSLKAKQLNIATMLAKNKMLEVEQEIDGKPFESADKVKEDNFKEPFQDYHWKKEIKEIEFPSLFNSASASGGAQGGTEAEGSGGPMVEQMTQMITKYLSDSIREVKLTISWKRGNAEQSFSLTTYWVDLNREMRLN